MFSARSLRVREKRPSPPLAPDYRRGTHSQATLSDDHSLLLVHQFREGKARSSRRLWFLLLFRR